MDGRIPWPQPAAVHFTPPSELVLPERVASLVHLCARMLVAGWRSLVVLAFVPSISVLAAAGGPRYIAGSSFFQSGVAGTPLRWSGGRVEYFTDLGDLSPILPQTEANAFVANAFARWTEVKTAALSATRSGSLDEDVNGSNVSRSGGEIVLPADVAASATKPLAIIYDADGAVTEVLLGSGASSPEHCDQNAVYGDVDRFSADGFPAHARVVLNGRCVRSAEDLEPLRYHLVRVLGQVLGLDWSQLNDSVTSGAATGDDIAGFPLMHAVPSLCGWSTGCVPGADQLRMDDRAAVSRLYPVTAANLAQFPGKEVFTDNTARIRGQVRFSGGRGMQGTNVVARLLDANGQPSRSVAASAVSGFLFRGNWGNAITGFTDGSGERWDRFGSEDSEQQGYYELSGLEIPAGSSSATYELQVEALRPEYVGNRAVGPYRLRQVKMSGQAGRVRVTLNRGSDVVQDIYLENSAQESGLSVSHNLAAPGALPGGGVWLGALDMPGHTEYYRFGARAGRVATFEVRAIGDDGQASEEKAMPVLGIWDRAAGEGSAPAIVANYFNANVAGLSQMKAQFTASGEFTVGVADYRGDGRPDFRYRARVLYADRVEPERANTAGGTVLTIRGMGFVAGMVVKVDGTAVPLQSFTPETVRIVAPAHADGNASIELIDPETNAQALMLDAVRYGATAQDTISLVSAANPNVPVGTQAPFPITVRVATPDGKPIAGASVRFTSSATVLLVPCSSTSCTLATNEVGEASVNVLVQSAGVATVTATLATGARVSGTVNGISTSLAIVAAPPTFYVAQNSSGTVVLRAKVVENGTAAAGKTVSFVRLLGNGVLGSSVVSTNSLGEASSPLTFSNIGSQVRVGACVLPANSPCATFDVFPVAATGLVLQKLSGDQQYAAPGAAFAPVVVRVLDSSTPGKPVAGVRVVFQVTVLRVPNQTQQGLDGEVLSGRFAGAVAVSSTRSEVLSDSQGLAGLTVTAPTGEAGLQLDVQASAAGTSQRFTLRVWPVAAGDLLAPAPAEPGGMLPLPQTKLQQSATDSVLPLASARKNLGTLVTVPEVWDTRAPLTTDSADFISRPKIPADSLATAIGAADNPANMTIEVRPEHMVLPAETSAALALTVRVLRAGKPALGELVDFRTSSVVELSASQALTDENGEAGVVLTTGGLRAGSEVTVNACLPAAGSVCATFSISAVDQATVSGKNPPTHLRSCTTAGCSVASAPNDLRQENTASAKESSGAAE
jgi:hypothetical protein